MSLRNNANQLSRALLVVVALWSWSAIRADDIASYLEHHGLHQLLAIHLEQRLESATGDEREEIVSQLTDLYVQLLTSVIDPVQRIIVEERSRQLLSQAPEGESGELHVALLKGTYRSIERIAESHRLRLAEPNDVDDAKAMLQALIPDLQGLRQRLKEKGELTNLRLSRSVGKDAVLLGEAVDRTVMIYHEATFLTAWALYYQSFLHDRPDNARAAEIVFGELLAPDVQSVEPDDVSVDLRSIEAVARSILGMALCKSLTSSTATAQAWLELLEHETTYESLRNELAVWFATILLENEQFEASHEVLRTYEAEHGAIPALWLRLAAVYALESKSSSPDAREIIDYGIAKLAVQQQIGHIQNLAERYGVDALGESGFAIQFIRGVLAYRATRQLDESDPSAHSGNDSNEYKEARAFFHAALKEVDADKYPEAKTACEQLIAWSHFYLEEYEQAGQLFEKVSAKLSGNFAADALWMAVVSYDRLANSTNDPSVQRHLTQLIDQFLLQFPSSMHSPKLIIKRASFPGENDAERVNELLSIPENSEVYDAAQQQAASLLYKLFRNVDHDSRYEFGRRFLTVALKIVKLIDWQNDSAMTDGGAITLLCRQILEVALSDVMRDASAAGMTLTIVDSLGSRPHDFDEKLRSEISFRRVQEQLLLGDLTRASHEAEDLWNRDFTSTWSQRATREVFHYAHRTLKSTLPEHVEKERLLKIVHRFGERILREFKDDPAALTHPTTQSYYAAVADAAMQLWKLNSDDNFGRASLVLFEELLSVDQDHAKYLRSTAILSETFGKQDLSLDCWRRLASGSPPGTDGWYEAKVHLIRLLADRDPNHAREVLNQHKQLYPNYGPEPWGSDLKAIDLKLGQSPEQSTKHDSLPESEPTQP